MHGAVSLQSCRSGMNRAGSTSAHGKVQTISMSCIQNVVQHRDIPQWVQPCSAPEAACARYPVGKQQQCCTVISFADNRQILLSCLLVPLSEGFSWIYLVTAESSFCAWFTIFFYPNYSRKMQHRDEKLLKRFSRPNHNQVRVCGYHLYPNVLCLHWYLGLGIF